MTIKWSGFALYLISIVEIILIIEGFLDDLS